MRRHNDLKKVYNYHNYYLLIINYNSYLRLLQKNQNCAPANYPNVRANRVVETQVGIEQQVSTGLLVLQYFEYCFDFDCYSILVELILQEWSRGLVLNFVKLKDIFIQSLKHVGTTIIQ